MEQLDKAVELINEAKAEIDKNNTSNRNTGHRNTGSWNAGHRNTGSCNTGSWNTGDWNTGDWNTGYFNTETPKTIKVFGKKCCSWRHTPFRNVRLWAGSNIYAI